jgi:hypothetical protein
MTCYIVLGSFIASNLALIAGVMLNQRGLVLCAQPSC